jgi:type II secretory pathway component GspD/PulD (secretin)
MQLSNINFKTKKGNFLLSSGSLGQEEKDLIKDSIDIWTQKTDTILSGDINDEERTELQKQYDRFVSTKNHVDFLTILDDNNNDEAIDDETNLMSYNDLADIMTSINQHIEVIENDGSYLTSNVAKYETLQRLLSELNEQKTKFVRVPTKPFGLQGRRK